MIQRIFGRESAAWAQVPKPHNSTARTKDAKSKKNMVQQQRPASILPRGGAAYTIGITTIAAIAGIVYSHQQQVTERQVMRAGVERDKERLRLKKRLAAKTKDQHEQNQET